MIAVASVGREPQRPGEVVGVRHPDHAVGLRALERVEVDVDQVVGVAAGQAAHQQHLEVLDQLVGGHAERGGGVLEPDLAAGVQERHQRQQPGDLVLAALAAGFAALMPLPRPATAAQAARSRSSRSVRGLLDVHVGAVAEQLVGEAERRCGSTTSRSQAVRVVGAGDAGLDASRRRGAARSPAPVRTSTTARSVGRRGREPPGGGADVGAGRDVVRRRARRRGGPRPGPGRAGRPAPRRGRCRSPTTYQRPE